MKQFSEQMRQAIDRSGISMPRLAELSGVDKSIIWRFAMGGQASTKTLDRLAPVLGWRLKVDGED